MTNVRIEPNALDSQVLTRAQLPTAPPRGAQHSELERAATDFEAYLLKMLLEQMQDSVESGGLFDSESTRGYRVLVDDALARRAAEAGTFGLARQLLEQWEAEP